MATKPLVIASGQSTNASSDASIDISSRELEARDQFGRLDSERIVELTPEVAEAINVEVVQGKHDTYDDALAHVIARGLAEIKRTRQAAEALRATKDLAREAASYNTLLTSNPSLITNAEFVGNMMRKLGELSSKTASRKR